MVASEEFDLEGAWQKILAGDASNQMKVDAAWRTGEIRAFQHQKNVESLLDDQDEEVRRYALQCLVLDLQHTTDEVQARCWRFLRLDPDEDVRAMAATCLGHILQRTRSIEAFESLVSELKNEAETPFVRLSIFRSLFDIAGGPPLEWPGLFDSERLFTGTAEQWERVAALKASLLVPP